MQPYISVTATEHAQAINSLEELSELLFSLRWKLYDTNDKLSLTFPNKKRKRGSPAYVDVALKDLEACSGDISTYERSVILKWSDKILSATMEGQLNKFKAIGSQNTVAQIDGILAQDMERLIERTRVRRGPGTNLTKVIGRVSQMPRMIFRGQVSEYSNQYQEKIHEPVEGEKDIDADVFDDTDFYQSLLRSVIDSGHSGTSNGILTGSAYSHFNNTSNKKSSNSLDPKASKGRKLRYHVHEKLQNFMTPIPTETWEKEQVEELFKGLLGGDAQDDAFVEAALHQQDTGFSVSPPQEKIRIF